MKQTARSERDVRDIGKRSVPRAEEIPETENTKTKQGKLKDIGHRGMRKGRPAHSSRPKRKLSKRTAVASVIVILLIPFVIVAGIKLLQDRNYYIVSLAIIVLAMTPFALVFEGRKPQSRDLVVIAVMVALAVAGRAAFFMVPQFKPVVAIVIISGVTLGAESGFIVGALTGFVSNFIFGQGPWTPWQMFAFGLIGFLAGLLFQKGILPKKRLPLCVFGGLVTQVLYGAIVDTAAVLMFVQELNREIVIATFISGIPFNAIHASATIFFLFVLSGAMIEKLDRVKKKFGLIEYQESIEAMDRADITRKNP